jgi:hypothetical protein
MSDPTVPLDGGDAFWIATENQANRSGHAVVRCPRCNCRQLTTRRTPSQTWPRCRVCLPVATAPRVVPVSDLGRIRKRPAGTPRTLTELRRTTGIGQWGVLEECPGCHDRLVACRHKDGFARCGGCGTLSYIVEVRSAGTKKSSPPGRSQTGYSS